MAVSQKALDQKQAAEASNKDVNLMLDTVPDHEEAAKKKLVSELRSKNQNETTFNFTMLGDTRYAAGITVALDGSFGVYAGAYLIDKCIHRIGRQGYTTELEGHKVLKGHDHGSAPQTQSPGKYSPGKSVPEQLRTNFTKWIEDSAFEHSRSAFT